MRTLHVAAMPFPSHQGTQALIHQMLEALAQADHDTHLVCYARAGAFEPHSYRVHRPALFAHAGSFRSGPSFEKPVLDAVLAMRLRELVAQLHPDAVVAHHVEAALCAHALGVRPLLFLAHTSLEHELPSYFPRSLRALLARTGRSLDRGLCRASTRTLAVSPLLADLLSNASDVRVHALPLPWPTAVPCTREERARARAELGLSESHEVVLYAGNLDSYQGLDVLLRGLAYGAQRRPLLRWLVATESHAHAFRCKVAQHGLSERVVIAKLAGELARRTVHAAADVLLVPRQSAGGIPIKLLDGLARDLPVIASERASAGLLLSQVCTIVRDDSPDAWQRALDQFFSATDTHQRPTMRGSAYIRDQHSTARFVGAFVEHVDAARNLHRA